MMEKHVKTLVIPNSLIAAYLNAGHTQRVCSLFKKETGLEVLDAGVLPTTHGERCVVILDGVFTDKKTLQNLSNWAFVTTGPAWWYE